MEPVPLCQHWKSPENDSRSLSINSLLNSHAVMHNAIVSDFWSLYKYAALDSEVWVWISPIFNPTVWRMVGCIHFIFIVQMSMTCKIRFSPSTQSTCPTDNYICRKHTHNITIYGKPPSGADHQTMTNRTTINSNCWAMMCDLYFRVLQMGQRMMDLYTIWNIPYSNPIDREHCITINTT